MENISDLLTVDRVHCNFPAPSRKRLLQWVAESLSEAGNDDDDGQAYDLYDALMERERLGSTGLGEGVAIPHCRVDCSAMHGVLLSLEEPIDFEAPDGQAVDLIFVLIVPVSEKNAHISALRQLAGIFQRDENLQRLRSANTDEQLLSELRQLEIASQSEKLASSRSA